MIAKQNYGSHSAYVEMQLIVDGTTISITHMGPDFLIVESPVELPRQGVAGKGSVPSNAAFLG